MRIAKRSSKLPARRSPVSSPSRNQSLNPKSNRSLRPKPRLSLKPKPSPSLGLNRSPRPRPKTSHERYHGEPAAEDQQCRRSPIRRSLNESPGRFEYRPIRAIGTRLGGLLSDRGAGVEHLFPEKRAGSVDDGGKSTRRGGFRR